jgi:hypothetical protein
MSPGVAARPTQKRDLRPGRVDGAQRHGALQSSVHLMKRLAAAAEGRRNPLNFIHRVYRTTAVVSLIVALALLGYFGWVGAANYLLGALIGIALMWMLERTVDVGIRAAVRDGKAGRSGGAVIVGINVAKYMVIAVGLYLLVANNAVRVWFLLAGYGTIYAVIALKMVGRLLIGSSDGDEVAVGDAPGGSPGGL